MANARRIQSATERPSAFAADFTRRSNAVEIRNSRRAVLAFVLIVTFPLHLRAQNLTPTLALQGVGETVNALGERFVLDCALGHGVELGQQLGQVEGDSLFVGDGNGRETPRFLVVRKCPALLIPASDIFGKSSHTYNVRYEWGRVKGKGRFIMAAATGIVVIKGLGDRALSREMARFTLKAQGKLVRRATKASAKRLKLNVTAGLAGKYVKVRSGRYVAAWLSQRVVPLPRFRNVFGHGVMMPTREALGIPLKAKGNPYYPRDLEYGTKNMPAKAPIRKSVNEHQRFEMRVIRQQLKREIENEWRAVARKLAKARKIA